MFACNKDIHEFVELPTNDLPLVGGSYFGKGVFEGRFYLDSVKSPSNIIYYANPSIDSNLVYQRKVRYNQELRSFQFEKFEKTDFVFKNSLFQVFHESELGKPIPFINDKNLKWEVYKVK